VYLTRRRGDAEEDAENLVRKSQKESAESAEDAGLRGAANLRAEG
jgi:hypothetical protein